MIVLCLTIALLWLVVGLIIVGQHKPTDPDLVPDDYE